MLAPQPIADLSEAVSWLEVIKTRHTDDPPIMPYANLQRHAFLGVLQARSDVAACVFDLSAKVQPRQPLAQIGAIGVREREEFLRVLRLALAKFEMVVDSDHRKIHNSFSNPAKGPFRICAVPVRR